MQPLPARMETHMGTRLQALRRAAYGIVQMAVAAGLSWWVAHDLVGHTSTYFAPVASTIVLSIAPGERSRRAVEMVIGVAVGIAVADVIIRAIGTGAIQIGLIVLLSVTVAVLLGAGPLIVTQAASTAVLVAALPVPETAPTRFLDALIGGFIGLGILIAAPRNPVTPLRREAESFLAATGRIVALAADALEQRDAPRAGAALAEAYDLGRLGKGFDQLLKQGRETALIAPIRWNLLSGVERYVQAAPHIDSAARNVRVLARAVRTALETGQPFPPDLPGAVREVGLAVGELAGVLAGDRDEGQLVEHALHAAATATEGLEEGTPLAVNVIVQQVRSTAVDLLGALGVDRRDAVAHVRVHDE